MLSLLGFAAAVAAIATTGSQVELGKRVIVCDNTTAPTQVRIAYAGPGGMAVSWNTNAQLTLPTVLYGTSPNLLTGIASSQISVTYPTSSTYNNHVKIYGLQPNTLYYYLPLCQDLTAPFTFTTARTAGDKTPFNFAMVADMGTFGPDGLSTTVGTGAANPLAPGDLTTIQSLQNLFSAYDFIWHGKLYCRVWRHVTDVKCSG
jgi:acid phosphatase type 7